MCNRLLLRGVCETKEGQLESLESQPNSFHISEMEGIESGDFVMNDCETTEVEVDN